jgi:hypothetical protein
MTLPLNFASVLESISIKDDQMYGRARSLLHAEVDHQEIVLSYTEHSALSNAFKCFFLETSELINIKTIDIKEQNTFLHSIFLTRLVDSFKALCGAEITSTWGYPNLAYTLLRNIYDDTLLTSAALQNIVTFYGIEGAQGFTYSPTPKEIKKGRKNTEAIVRTKMTGLESGLSPSTQAELKKWDDLFDKEVHGARLSRASVFGFINGSDPLPVSPKFNELIYSLFLNRYFEISWMVHRLIPGSQLKGLPFPKSWQEKWQILDVSFEQMVHSLTTSQGKLIGAAVTELVTKKFPFNAQSKFTLI